MYTVRGLFPTDKLKALKKGDQLELCARVFGYKQERRFIVEIREEIGEVKRCGGCGINLEGKKTKIIDNLEYCIDCAERRK